MARVATRKAASGSRDPPKAGRACVFACAVLSKIIYTVSAVSEDRTGGREGRQLVGFPLKSPSVSPSRFSQEAGAFPSPFAAVAARLPIAAQRRG
jgi:hypothetical protein